MSRAAILSDPPTSAPDACTLFDAAPAVAPEFMIGTWRGEEVPTGHPLDGALAATGWWGKQFVDAESVHPLLFPDRSGTALWPLEPRAAFGGLPLLDRFPALIDHDYSGLIRRARPLARARGYAARLRSTRFRDVETATMVYDRLPINDAFRRLDNDTVLGAMDLKGVAAPYFFILTRDESLPVRFTAPRAAPPAGRTAR